jgi:hypothetical protein
MGFKDFRCARIIVFLRDSSGNATKPYRAISLYRRYASAEFLIGTHPDPLSRSSLKPEGRYGVVQFFTLVFQGSRCRCCLFDQCRVLLRNVVHLGDGKIDLSDAATLFVGCVSDLFHDGCDPVCGQGDLAHGAAGFPGKGQTLLHRVG